MHYILINLWIAIKLCMFRALRIGTTQALNEHMKELNVILTMEPKVQ